MLLLANAAPHPAWILVCDTAAYGVQIYPNQLTTSIIWDCQGEQTDRKNITLMTDALRSWENAAVEFTSLRPTGA